MDRDTRILDRNGLTEAAYLQSYDPGRYERPSVAADMAIFYGFGRKQKIITGSFLKRNWAYC